MAMDDRWGQDQRFRDRWGSEDRLPQNRGNESRTSFAIPVGNSHYHTFMLDRHGDLYPGGGRSNDFRGREGNPMRGRWS